MSETLNSGTYEIIQNRLNEQKNDLIERLKQLNEDRKNIFGGIDFSLIANERISTDHNCIAKDIYSLGDHLILGSNAHLGLQTEINISDVFSIYTINRNRFEPQDHTLINDEVFIDEFKNLYKYYRNTFFARFSFTENYLYMVFQLSESTTDIKAFKWLIKEGQLIYIDSRSASETAYPPQHGFVWMKATRDMQRSGKHPHISLADKVFVESIGGDITIKVEDNTDTGKGIYSEDVIHKDQNLDDAEIHFCDLDNLVLFKIKPYQETERYFIYNHKEKTVSRADALKYSGLLLPESQGVLFSNGYALQTGGLKVISQDQNRLYYLKTIVEPNGENFLYVFYDDKTNNYQLISYNIITQTIETPIRCSGFTFLSDGRLIYLRESIETTKNHLAQIWQTPFSKELLPNAEKADSLLYKIGNKDIVRVMAESQELITLLNKKDSYSGLYNDIVKLSTFILDTYYFLGEEEVHKLDQPLKEIRGIAHSAINEYEKVVEQRKNTEEALEKIKHTCDKILDDTKRLHYSQLTEYIDALSQIRALRGEVIGTRELKYADTSLLDSLEKALADRYTELSNACVDFLLQEGALLPYEEKAQKISEEIIALQKTIDAKIIDEDISTLSGQLELLVDIVNNLKIEDASQSTQIIENISLIFARLNQERLELSKRKREISGKELASDFQAQITLFDQSVINFLELSQTPEKCDEYLTKLSIQLEEMETKFIDFDEFIQQIGAKREEVYGHFQNKRVQLTESRNKRTQSLFDAAQRILNSVQTKAESFDSENEINGYFASDLMVEKVRDLSRQLVELGDSAKSEEIQTLLKTCQQESVRKLKDKKEIYVDGESVIALGDYKFAVNKQKLDLTLVLRNAQYYYHLTGTSFYEPLNFNTADEFKDVWNQELVSENTQVKKFEYLAWNVFSNHQEITTAEQNEKAVQQFMTQHFGEGLVKGIHDKDAQIIVTRLQQTHNELGLMRFTTQERALAQLFWFFLNPERKEYYAQQFEATAIIAQSFAVKQGFEYLSREMAEEMRSFASIHNILTETDYMNAAIYLKEEDKENFLISEKAGALYELFLKELKEKGKDLEFFAQIQAMHQYPSACYYIAEGALQAFDPKAEKNIIDEVLVFVMTQKYDPKNVRHISYESILKELKSLEKDTEYNLNYFEFVSRLNHFNTITVPKYKRLQELKYSWVDGKKKALKLETFQPQILSSFVRNKLINEVYFPLIGANLAKQLGTVGLDKRTDRMGMLLLVSPPGYGKTTLMEYMAERMGLVFMKINGPSLGYDIVSTDPSEARNAGAKQELEKLNLALEMGDNVMLYLDDIQHCNPEFLQKFISLADGQRKIEGIYNGESKTYDLRSKRFCLVMAGNPYTENGEKFKIPDMLANRSDTYNLGEISGSKTDLFDLSLIENALMSNEYLTRLTHPGMQNLYELYDCVVTDNPADNLNGNFSSNEISDFRAVLKNTIMVRNMILKVNKEYIASAAMSDDYRNEPSFKLQGSYRNMNKLIAQIQPILKKNEVMQIVLNHYQNESQTLTTGAEANMLKLKELIGVISEEETERWEEIKKTFVKNKTLKGLGENDRMSQIVALLAQFGDGLDGIKEALKKVE
ncbi:DNA repair ATPase [Chryseobacterium jejuense]|uniref:ATPase family associated with various cellular activities (AAA) n=1 Tax=Chryseobacterium jejuense TaxID=445960 RepID=A0A2X2VD66_CHRJE|nr:DNA repair ATPase [Chryseobacterium jejuense]SDI69440.1 ATPase family associated with various cellular activities (AAA) [Chryseobacterium jejuense]SQB26614.1 ATPase involved in DNA repair [Chryseobacterium jejuense]